MSYMCEHILLQCGTTYWTHRLKQVDEIQILGTWTWDHCIYINQLLLLHHQNLSVLTKFNRASLQLSIYHGVRAFTASPQGRLFSCNLNMFCWNSEAHQLIKQCNTFLLWIWYFISSKHIQINSKKIGYAEHNSIEIKLT